MSTFRETFTAAKKLVAAVGRAPWVAAVVCSRCDQADREHDESERQFCHVGHVPGKVCYAKAANALGCDWQLGLVLHEFGHMALLPHGEHTEADANEAASEMSGVRVSFKGADVLEWADASKARRLLAARMTPAEINRAIDAIDAKNSAVVDALIEAGRGHETMSEIMSGPKDDLLSNAMRECFDERMALVAEIEARYGPAAPRRLPTRLPTRKRRFR